MNLVCKVGIYTYSTQKRNYFQNQRVSFGKERKHRGYFSDDFGRIFRHDHAGGSFGGDGGAFRARKGMFGARKENRHVGIYAARRHLQRDA